MTIMDNEIKDIDKAIQKINRKNLYKEPRANTKKRIEWWNKMSAESISTISKKYKVLAR